MTPLIIAALIALGLVVLVLALRPRRPGRRSAGRRGSSSGDTGPAYAYADSGRGHRDHPDSGRDDATDSDGDSGDGDGGGGDGGGGE